MKSKNQHIKAKACKLFLMFIVVVLVGFTIRECNKSYVPYEPSTTARAIHNDKDVKASQRKPEKPETLNKTKAQHNKSPAGIDEIVAGLSKFWVEHDPDFDIRNQRFDIIVRNDSAKDTIVYVVVYAKNDKFIIPTGDIWPLPIRPYAYKTAKTHSGNLSAYDMTKQWDSQSEESKGHKITLAANSFEYFEAAIPMEDIPFNDWQIWIFSEAGKLIYDKSYHVTVE